MSLQEMIDAAGEVQKQAIKQAQLLNALKTGLDTVLNSDLSAREKGAMVKTAVEYAESSLSAQAQAAAEPKAKPTPPK